MRSRQAITIAAPPGAVWLELIDFANSVEWMRDAKRVTFTSPQRHGVGTEFECLTSVGPLRTRDKMRVTEWEAPRVLAVEHTGIVRGVGSFRLKPRRGGATRVIWSEQLQMPWWMGGPVGALAARPILRRIWKGNLRRLRARLEG